MYIIRKILQGDLAGEQEIPRKDGMVGHDLLALASVYHTTHGDKGHHLFILQLSTEELEQVFLHILLSSCPTGNEIVVHRRPWYNIYSQFVIRVQTPLSVRYA